MIESVKQKLYLSNIDFITLIGDSIFAKYIFHPWYTLLANEFSRKISNNSIIADIGCGQGDLIFELCKINNNCLFTGIDISPLILKKADKILKKTSYNNVEFVVSDADTIPAANGKYSFCYSTFSFHLWENPVIVLNEIYRIMSPASEFVLIDFNGDEKHEKENTGYLYSQADKLPFFLRSLIKRDIDWGYKTAGIYNHNEMKELIDRSLFTDIASGYRPVNDSPGSFLIEFCLSK